jgi:pimeloyl-ACP methyl ester carboxylesterase
MTKLRVLLLLFLAVSLSCVITFYTHPLWVADQIIRLNLWRNGVQSRYAQVGPYRIHYFEAAPPTGSPNRPLVLIHGLGSRGEDWAPLFSRLAAAGFHVYVPDLLGYGRSPQPDVDYSISLQEKLVVQFLQTLSLNKTDLGGWSMGGWVAAKLTLDHPELVTRLVLYDSAGIYFPATFDATLFTPTDPAALFHLTEMLDPNPHHLPSFIARAAIERLHAHGWIVQRSLQSITAGRDLLDFRLAQLHTPTLIVWGSKDVLIPLSAAEQMHTLIPNSSLDILDGCGHLAAAQCPNSALKATVDFLTPATPPAPINQTLPGR